MKLSLCMIVKNEAKNLPQCLNSAKSIVDEMIVLDTGSTDDTVAIAQSLGAIVHQFTWTQNFATARNESLKHATGDWILVLDADEVLAPDIAPLIRQVMQQEQVLVVNLVRQEVGATQSPYSLVSRLFRHHPEVQFSRPYHAMVDDSVVQLRQREPHWQVVSLSEVAILHYGYAPGAIAQRDKLQAAKTTMEQFFAEHPDDPYVCSKLGALYVQIGELQQGIELLQQGLGQQAEGTVLDAPVLYELHYHLGIAYNRLHQADESEQHYRTAIEQPILKSLKLGAYNNLGSLLKAKGALADARAIFEQALFIDPNFAIAHYNLGMTLKAMGKFHEAIAHYQTAIRLNPHHAEAHQNLGVVLLKLGKVPESLTEFGRAIALHEKHNPVEAQRLRQSLAAMGFQA
jgi:tetratricopeptide (TPR) repeat protein